MSYTITLRVYQTNTNAFFHVVEKTVWGYANGGTWDEFHGEHVLKMGGSGTCGTLRFQTDLGEKFVVAVAVHNYERWCDIVQDVHNDQTGATIQAEYYNGGDRTRQREKQLPNYSSVGSAGRNVSINFTGKEGNDLKADIFIK